MNSKEAVGRDTKIYILEFISKEEMGSKDAPHYNSKKDTLPGIPKNFGCYSTMQNDGVF